MCVTQITDDLSSVLSIIKTESKLCYLLVAFNINLQTKKVDSHVSAEEFLDTMCAFSELPFTTKPTRVTNNSPTPIDSIFIKNRINADGLLGIILTVTTDHFSIS